jgi:hypothetical protein
VTLRPTSYSDLSSPGTATGSAAISPARQFTEPLREMCTWALLVGNAVFQLLGITGLLVVIDRWGTDFGLRSAHEFPAFAGPVALGLPLGAILLATHLAPAVRRARTIMITALVELAVNAVFAAVTFLGAFAFDLASSGRATVEGLLFRGVWLGFLVVVSVLAIRIWLGLYPAAKPTANYSGFSASTYGKPYPGQPLYPQATYQPGAAQPMYPTAVADAVTDAGSSWPVVPPPPMPVPVRIEPDPTMRVPVRTQEIPMHSSDPTRIVIPVVADAANPPAHNDAQPRVEPHTRDMES